MHRRRGQRTRGRSPNGAATRLLAAATFAATFASATLPAAPAGADRSGAQRGDAYAVITNRLVPASDVTLAHLREMFLGTRRSWGDGSRVVVIVQSPGTRTRALVLRALYGMDEGAFRRYWIARTFRGDSAGGGPTLVASDAMARRLTATIPGAVAVVPVSEVDDGVRVLKLDGRLPGAEGYPLTGGAP